MRIVCLGDSNTYGYDPRSFFGERYPCENRWVDLLAKHTGHEIINAGVNGQEIPQNAQALQMLTDYTAVDLYIVMLGTNDLLQGSSAIEAAAGMEAFLNRLLLQGTQILLVAPPPMKRGAWVPSDTLVNESIRLAEECNQLAKKLNIPYADTRRWKIELCFDGVHFTEKGHHIFAESLMEIIPYILIPTDKPE